MLALPNEFGFSDEQQETQIATLIQEARGQSGVEVSIPNQQELDGQMSHSTRCVYRFRSSLRRRLKTPFPRFPGRWRCTFNHRHLPSMPRF